MGFAQLLGIAQVNQKDKTVTDVKLLKTKFNGAKKEKREKGKVAPNVQKFLQQKEAEEKRKRIEEKLKLQNLNELRTDRAKKYIIINQLNSITHIFFCSVKLQNI